MRLGEGKSTNLGLTDQAQNCENSESRPVVHIDFPPTKIQPTTSMWSGSELGHSLKENAQSLWIRSTVARGIRCLFRS